MKTEVLTPQKKRKTQQLVASTATPKLGIKGIRRRRSIKFNVENVAPNNNNKKLSPGSRQSVLSEYFTSPNKSSPKETPPLVDCKPTHEEPVQKMVNVPRLLSQLLRARVVLSRIPASEIPKSTPIQIQRRQSTNTAITDTATNKLERHFHRIVQRYCMKCKTLELDRNNLTKRVPCRKCGTTLLFICTKCNVRHYIENRHMKKHFSNCNGQPDPNTVPLEEVVVMFCAQCSFKSTYKYVMDKHMKNLGHEMFKGEKNLEPDVTLSLKKEDGKTDDWHVKETKKFLEKLAQNKAQFMVQLNANEAKKGIKRFCPKCKKKILATRNSDELCCTTCKTRLMYQCGKCKFKCGTYQFIYYHVKTKCYATVYRCPNCQFNAPFWNQMYVHLKTPQCQRQVSSVLPK